MDAVSPIKHPKLRDGSAASPSSGKTVKPSTAGGENDSENETGEEFTDEEHAELARLHALGIPVPGLLVKVDKHEARVWLEDLSVDCANGILRERVGRVVQRGIECVSGLWSGGF